MFAERKNATELAAEARWVVCLCAGWCRACDDYQTVFSQMAEEMGRSHPEACFVWVDVEDSADLVNDIDIETFPTLLVGSSKQLNFLGAVTPQPSVLSRLLDSLLAPDARHTDHLPATEQLLAQLAQSPGAWQQTALSRR